MTKQFTSEHVAALWALVVDEMPTPESTNRACTLLRQVEQEMRTAEARGFARAREQAARLFRARQCGLSRDTAQCSHLNCARWRDAEVTASAMGDGGASDVAATSLGRGEHALPFSDVETLERVACECPWRVEATRDDKHAAGCAGGRVREAIAALRKVTP